MPKESLLAPQASILRAVIDDVPVEPIEALTRQPGMRAVYRLTVRYHDGRARDSVATLVYRATDGARLETVYRAALGGRTIVRAIPEDRYQHFSAALRAVRFDQLRDQPDLPPPYAADLWLLERAAGTFSKSVILAPGLAADDYATVVGAVRTYLPEALREVP